MGSGIVIGNVGGAGDRSDTVKRSIRAMVLMLAAAGGITFLSATPAAACDCATATDAQAFASADVVFSGELIEVRTPPGDTYSSIDPERFVFDVQEVYKGDARSAAVRRDRGGCQLRPRAQRTGAVPRVRPE